MCIFCKIINHEIPSKIIYEDNLSIAILDLSQVNEGHTIVLSKKHFDNVLTIDDESYLAVMKTAKLVANALEKAYHPDGFNILNNCKEAAGQTIDHFHVHIIPRFKNDQMIIQNPDNLGKFDLDKVLEKIKKFI